MIDAYASEPQYLQHILPVWQALGDRAGTLYSETPPDTGRPILVAASGDLARAGRERAALMEHGAGLSYHGDKGRTGRVADTSASYAGGDNRGGAGLFLHPGHHPAALDAARYPAARVEVVGSPRLDTLPHREVGVLEDWDTPTVAVSFHWDTHIIPEARSAFIFYRDHVKRLAQEQGFRVIGHGHPRAWERLSGWYEKVGIEPVQHFDEVCRRADLYAVDNSSTLYEFAATGRPVVAMNAPFYRRDVHHGARFWDAVPGPQVDEPSKLGETIARALARDDWADRREAALDYVYAYREGAARRAADALIDWSEK